MTDTRIAGHVYDARHAEMVRETARISAYAARIRGIAHKAGHPWGAGKSKPHAAVPRTGALVRTSGTMATGHDASEKRPLKPSSS